MSNLFEDKSEMSGKANVQVAEPKWTYPESMQPASPMGAVVERGEAPVRVSQTLRERYTDRADDAMSVRNLIRPRRGHGY